MLPSQPAMEPQEELEQLLARQEALKQELKAKKKELQEAQRRQRANLQKQIRRAQVRLSSAERKQRTRRLIFLGSYLEHITGEDPAKRDSLMQRLDGFLERDRQRPRPPWGQVRRVTDTAPPVWSTRLGPPCRRRAHVSLGPTLGVVGEWAD